MNTYFYEGPVYEFDKCIVNIWRGYTTAVSEKKARCNLSFRFKMMSGRTVHSKIMLPGELKIVNSIDISEEDLTMNGKNEERLKLIKQKQKEIEDLKKEIKELRSSLHIDSVWTEYPYDAMGKTPFDLDILNIDGHSYHNLCPVYDEIKKIGRRLHQTCYDTGKKRPSNSDNTLYRMDNLKQFRDFSDEQIKLSGEMLNEITRIYNKYWLMAHKEDGNVE